MGNVGLLVLALAIVTVVVFLLNAYHAKQAEKRFMNSLYEDCGRLLRRNMRRSALPESEAIF